MVDALLRFTLVIALMATKRKCPNIRGSPNACEYLRTRSLAAAAGGQNLVKAHFKPQEPRR
eukprot:scaffold26951_cov80-Phaeocystis_antarctica.AAC.6